MHQLFNNANASLMLIYNLVQQATLQQEASWSPASTRAMQKIK